MKNNEKKARKKGNMFKLSTDVKAGAYVGIALSVGGGRSPDGG